jgi:DNA-binding NarL/FixJ family response regulator
MAISVLIVDDHTVVSEGLRYLIDAQKDIQVVGYAADGREAVNKARALKPDVVVMDISMPGLNGIEATRQIGDRLKNTNVVILSMHANHEYVLRALHAGARGYVLKKSAGQEVVDAIRAVYSGRHFFSPAITEIVIDDYLKERRHTSPLDSLSARERQILQMTAEGHGTQAIAKAMSLSPKTVDTYRSRMMNKLGITNRSALIKFAIQHGVTSAE